MRVRNKKVINMTFKKNCTAYLSVDLLFYTFLTIVRRFLVLCIRDKSLEVE